MIKTILSLKRDLEELKRVVSNLIRVGTIAERDLKRGYRVDFGPDDQGQSHLSAWLPHPDSGGETKTHLPLSQGQIVGVLSPFGDSEQGFIVRAGFRKGEDNPASELGLNRLVSGQVELSIDADKIVCKVGETRLEMTTQGIEITGRTLTHNGKNIGHTHKHSGVEQGGGITGNPLS